MRKFILLAAALCAAFVTPANAQTNTITMTDTGWRVAHDPKTNTCGISKEFSRGTFLVIEYVPSTNKAHVAMVNLDLMPGPAHANRTYRVELGVDAMSPWYGDIRLSPYDDDGRNSTALEMSLSADFLKEFAAGSKLSVRIGGKPITTLNLEGTREASDLLVYCGKRAGATKVRQ